MEGTTKIQLGKHLKAIEAIADASYPGQKDAGSGFAAILHWTVGGLIPESERTK